MGPPNAWVSQRKSLYSLMIILKGNRELPSADNLKKKKKKRKEKKILNRERRWLGKLGESKVASGHRG